MAGVVIGILVGDALLYTVGPGPVQIGLAVGIAIAFALTRWKRMDSLWFTSDNLSNRIAAGARRRRMSGRLVLLHVGGGGRWVMSRVGRKWYRPALVMA
jgi:hypothetical protein